MRRLALGCLLVVLGLLPGEAAPADLHMLDWLPGDDPSFHAAITGFFRLDAGKMPYLQPTADGFALVNPGGAPAAIAWTPFSADGEHARAYTLRFEARSDGPMRRVSATLLTERLDFEADGEWREQGVTATLDGPSGPGSIIFSLRGRAGRLEVRRVELVPVQFVASAERLDIQEGGLVVHLHGEPPTGLRLEARTWATEEGRAKVDGYALSAAVAGGAFPPLFAEGHTPVDLGHRPVGLRWRVLGADGRVVWQGADVPLRLLPPEPRRPSDVAIVGRQLLVTGSRFFPIGLYAHETSVQAVEDAADVGVNLLIMAPGPQLAEAVAAARRRGVEVILEGGVGGIEDPASAARALVDQYGKLDILGWSPVDEPDLHREWLPKIRPFYEALVKADGRPVFQANHSPSTFPVLATATDILGVDPYPVGTIPRPLGMASDWTSQGVRTGRPTWYVQQAFAESPQWNRPPTPDEMHLTTWLALTHGATGVVYYAMHEILYKAGPGYRWDLRKTPLWEEIRREAREIREAAPWLLTTTIARGLKTTAPGLRAYFFNGDGQMPDRLHCVLNITGASISGSVDFGELLRLRPFPASPVPLPVTPTASMRLDLPPYGVVLFLGESLRSAAFKATRNGLK